MTDPNVPPPAQEPQQPQPQYPQQQPEQQPAKKNKLVQVLISIAIFAAVAGFFWWLRQDDAGEAKVGDCVAQSGESSLDVVDCKDAGATFKVVGRVENQTEIAANISSCSDFPNATTTYWQGEQGEEGLVLCLAPATK